MGTTAPPRRGGQYYSPNAEPLKVLLGEQFTDSTWAILWSAGAGLVVEGQAHERPGLYYLVTMATKLDADGYPVWLAGTRWRPDGVSRAAARKGPWAKGRTPIAALELIYPALEWADQMAAEAPGPELGEDSTVGRCRSCQAAIRWVTTAGGKPMPVDLDTLLVVPGDTAPPRATLVTPSGEVVTGRMVREPESGNAVAGSLSHFSTCPNASAHRRTR